MHPTRRTLLSSFAGGLVVGGTGVYAGLSATDTGYGSIEWANERDEAVWVTTTIRSEAGLLADSEVASRSEYRIFPTEHTRAGDTNVVETGDYAVDVEVESRGGGESAGPFTTTWSRAGCYHQRLIVRVTRDLTVEFLQKEC